MKDRNKLTSSNQDSGRLLPATSYFALPQSEVADGGGSLDRPDYGLLLRRYILLAALLMFLGGAAGFFSVAYFAPVYKSRAMLEVEAISDNLLRSHTGETDSTSQVTIQTQIQLLRSSVFMRRVMERLQLETVPPAPARSDIFSRLRRRLRTSTQDPMTVMKEGLDLAFATFDARPVNGTRIIEISCDSTNPEIAANFVNTLATEYIEQSLQARSQNAQRTGQWLAGQLEETRAKLQEADQRLQEFVRNSGNLFVSQDNTLADSKLRQLQGELASIQADRIAKQSRYEMAMKSPPEALPDVLDDGTLRGYQSRIADLRRELSALTVSLMPENPKVKKVQAQITELQSTLEKEVSSVVKRIHNDYEAALRKEKLLSSAYALQAGQVSAQAGKAAQFNALKREGEILRQTYNAMLLQANEASIASSVPMSNIRLVDPGTPPQQPYKPRPAVNIGFGILAGFFVSCGIGFLREKLDQRVRSPSHARSLLNLPQLGVIPSVQEAKQGWRFLPSFRKNKAAAQDGGGAVTVYEGSNSCIELPAWQQRPLLAESFRVTLASLMRDSETFRRPRVILVTSPGPAEGKTTIASNLGIALAETGRKVLLFDADFRRPRLHKVFAIPNTWGVADLLGEEIPIGDYPLEMLAAATAIPELHVLPNGSATGSVAKSLYSSRLRELFQRLRKEFDTILIDVPPMLQVADARVIVELADGVVLVLRSGVTDRDSAREAYEQLHADGAVILGTVLNDWKPSKSQMKRHYYYERSEQ